MLWTFLPVAVLLAFLASAFAAEPAGPTTRPADWPTLDRDVVVMVLGSSVSVRRYGVHGLPAWTGGANRTPPQCSNGQNVFFRVFEMLNDHENMRWRRLPHDDWTRAGEWKVERNLPYRSASPRFCWAATDPTAYAEITLPAGFAKCELIYCSDPAGDGIKVTIDGKAPAANAVIDTFQDTTVPPTAKRGEAVETLDSHGKPRTIRPPKRGIRNIVELRARYALDPASAHTLRVRRSTAKAGKRILLWGLVYWRGNCVQVVQRAKGGINCGDLPRYAAIQEVTALRPDYVLMEAINIRSAPSGVTSSLDPGYAWCARQVKAGRFRMLVYSTPQASSREFRTWFADPKRKPPYGGTAKTVADENADACHAAVAALCEKYGFPLVDVGATVDACMAKHPTIRFVPHILADWYHPNQWGAACFGRTLYDGIRKHWPELPIRPIHMPDPPAPAGR